MIRKFAAFLFPNHGSMNGTWKKKVMPAFHTAMPLLINTSCDNLEEHLCIRAQKIFLKVKRVEKRE